MRFYQRTKQRVPNTLTVVDRYLQLMGNKKGADYWDNDKTLYDKVIKIDVICDNIFQPLGKLQGDWKHWAILMSGCYYVLSSQRWFPIHVWLHPYIYMAPLWPNLCQIPKPYIHFPHDLVASRLWDMWWLDVVHILFCNNKNIFQLEAFYMMSAIINLA